MNDFAGLKYCSFLVEKWNQEHLNVFGVNSVELTFENFYKQTTISLETGFV